MQLMTHNIKIDGKNLFRCKKFQTIKSLVYQRNYKKF